MRIAGYLVNFLLHLTLVFEVILSILAGELGFEQKLNFFTSFQGKTREHI